MSTRQDICDRLATKMQVSIAEVNASVVSVYRFTVTTNRNEIYPRKIARMLASCDRQDFHLL